MMKSAEHYHFKLHVPHLEQARGDGGDEDEEGVMMSNVRIGGCDRK